MANRSSVHRKRGDEAVAHNVKPESHARMTTRARMFTTRNRSGAKATTCTYKVCRPITSPPADLVVDGDGI